MHYTLIEMQIHPMVLLSIPHTLYFYIHIVVRRKTKYGAESKHILLLSGYYWQ